MKIKKTLFLVELEITPNELRDLHFNVPRPMGRGLMTWIYKQFGLNLWIAHPIANPIKKDEHNTNTD